MGYRVTLMRILMVAGIYEPEIGGPATYAARLRQQLSAHGHEVTVVTYAAANGTTDTGVIRVARGNKYFNRIRYFFAAWPQISRSEVVYMLDWFAAGFPAALAARMLGKPYIVRVGGDYLWEQRYLESGREPIPLAAFYARGLHQEYPMLFRVIRFVLAGAAHVVFNSDVQKQLYETHYGLTRTSVIHNPVPNATPTDAAQGSKKEFVYWGRFIVMKNVTALVRAFALADIPNYTLALIGEGPRRSEIVALIQELGMEGRISLERAMPNAAVLARVRGSRAFVLPSWTDISPNQVHEALSIGLPALVTKENYLAIRSQLPMTIDPASDYDIAEKLRMLADDTQYADFAERFRAIRFEKSWDDIAREHEALFANNV